MIILSREELCKKFEDNPVYQNLCEDIYGKSYQELETENLQSFMDNRQVNPKRLTLEETNMVISRKVPENLRIQAVYVPIVSVVISMRMLQKAIDLMVALQASSVKKITRDVRCLISEYESNLYRKMSSTLYNGLQKTVTSLLDTPTTFSPKFTSHFHLLQSYLKNEAKSQDVDFDEWTDLVIYLMIASSFGKFANALDKEYADLVNNSCGDIVTYTFQPDELLRKLLVDIDQLLVKLYAPELVTSQVIDLEKMLYVMLKELDMGQINRMM